MNRSYSIEETRVGALNARDPIFDLFRKLYTKFDWWLLSVSHRDAYVVKDDDTIVAIMIVKRESKYELDPEIQHMLPQQSHLKICSIRSIKENEGLGSVLIDKAIEVAEAGQYPYVYFTLHKSIFNEQTDRFFVNRGFEQCGSTKDEVVYIRNLVPIEEVKDEPKTKPVERKGLSLLKSIGKLFLEAAIILWFAIFFDLAQKFDSKLVGLIVNYIGLIPLHYFLWEGIQQKLSKRKHVQPND